MPDRDERDQSRRPQDRDFTVDQWEKFPFDKSEDPYENRSGNQARKPAQSQYKYEGWEEEAFPNKQPSETPAAPGSSPEKEHNPNAHTPEPKRTGSKK